jgi:prefoldin subunit 5
MMLFPIICCCFACTAYIVFRHGRSSAELSSLQEEIEYVKDAKTELKPTVDDLEELVSTKKNEVDKLVVVSFFVSTLILAFQKNLKSMREVNAETANQIDNEWKATMNRENLHKQLQALRHDRKCLKTAQKGLTTPINEQVTEVKEKFNRYSD